MVLLGSPGSIGLGSGQQVATVPTGRKRPGTPVLAGPQHIAWGCLLKPHSISVSMPAGAALAQALLYPVLVLSPSKDTTLPAANWRA